MFANSRMMFRRVGTRLSAAAIILSLPAQLIGGVAAAPAVQVEAFADEAFERTWARTDGPVAKGAATRTWFWGPGPISAGLTEDNKESPGGKRKVQYFDKSRMEINNPGANSSDTNYVTNGLLTVELVSGRMQVGESSYTESSAACIPITGDFGEQNAPTYAAMQHLSNTTIGDHPATSAMGAVVTASVDASGEVGNNPAMASQDATKIGYFDDVTKHNIPTVFWTFLNQSGTVEINGATSTAKLSEPWNYASGRPISEAYWTKATIAGKSTDVMVQLYERRVLTYVPTNEAAWQVEMGNIGRHYWSWRYENVGLCSPPASGNVTFQVFGDANELNVFQSVVASYKTVNPNVNVTLNHVPAQGDHINRLLASFAAGTPPDVFLINYRRYGQFAANGVLEPLGDYLAKSPTVSASDYYTQSMTAFTYEGTLQCIPQNISSLSVYYNKDMFTKYNVPLPTANWTWQDFVSAAKMLTKDTDGDGANDIHGLGVETQLIRLAPFIWQHGGELVDNYDKPTDLLLDSPLAREAAQWFVDLSLKEKVVPSEAETKAEALDVRFLNGKLGMFLGSRADTPTFRTIKGFTWDVNALPGDKTQATILHSDAYCMAASSPNKDATWDFIQYALGPRGQTVASKLGRIVPSLKSVASSPAYLDPTQPPANSKMYLDVIPTIRRVPVSAAWPAVETAVNAEIDRAFYGHATLDEAIQVAITKANAAFAKVNNP